MTRILIIEDDEAIAELEKDYLELDGYKVTICATGNEGVEMALAEPFDLFIIDIMLPGMDGFEICRTIRKSKETPILIVSARKDDIDKIRGLGLGADDYITKPFSPGELVARVKSHLSRFKRLAYMGRGTEKEDNIVEIRGLKIDRVNSRVWSGEEEIPLTSKEFELLSFLMEHPGKVYSKEDLFKEIWDNDAIGDTSTVTVHVKRIREKIELNPSKPQYIDTIWGVGYRFKV